MIIFHDFLLLYQAAALEGQKESVVVDYILKVRPLIEIYVFIIVKESPEAQNSN